MTNDFYSRYKAAHDAAFACLVACDIQHLPVNVSDIVKYYGGKVIINNAVNMLKPDEDARLFIDDGNPTIVVRVTSPRRMRFSIAHELGHYLLCHPPEPAGYNSRSVGQPRTAYEREADAFAGALLAPACVLISLKIAKPETAGNIFKISREAARVRIDQVRYLYRTDACVCSAAEVPVYYQLMQDIAHLKNNNLYLHACSTEADFDCND